MIAWGLEKKALVANIWGLVINAAVISILIPKYGMYGAAVGTIFSEGIVVIILAIYFKRQTGSFFAGTFVKILIISIIAILPGAFLKYYFHLPYIGIGVSALMLILMGMIFKIFTVKNLKEYVLKK
jgi:O-antigen/teichoic acid export membrane protein